MPLAKLYLDRVGFPLPEDIATPEIVTGIEAYGKVGDLDKLKQFTEVLQLTNTWPEGVQERVKWEVLAAEVAENLSMKLDFLMNQKEWRSYQEGLAKQREAEQAAEIAKAGTPALIKQQGGNNA